MTDECVSEWLRECSVCYTRGRQNEFVTCEQCGAMIYCSKDCQQSDWNVREAAAAECSHQMLCDRLKGYMSRERELSDFPMTYAADTTDGLFHEHKAAEFLKQRGVYGQGLWRRESPLLHKTQLFKKCGYFTKREECKWVLPEESSLLTSFPRKSAPSPSDPLTDWRHYYVFRELPLNSPVAAVLSYPLTLYYILTSCLSKDEPDLFKRIQSGELLVIHLLGVEKEVEMKEAFLECARLLPSCQLHITMFGRQMSKLVEKFSWHKENLHLDVCRMLYHESTLPPPHVAIGFNAGLPAYRTWPPTLSKLKRERTPAYFTDQSEYSCECVSSAVGSLGIQGISPPVINPFRSPMRIVTREQNMPWFPNAFLFQLLYGQNQ